VEKGHLDDFSAPLGSAQNGALIRGRDQEATSDLGFINKKSAGVSLRLILLFKVMSRLGEAKDLCKLSPGIAWEEKKKAQAVKPAPFSQTIFRNSGLFPDQCVLSGLYANYRASVSRRRHDCTRGGRELGTLAFRVEFFMSSTW
jgi:hypothetical protein